MIGNRDYNQKKGTQFITVEPHSDEVLIVLMARGTRCLTVYCTAASVSISYYITFCFWRGLSISPLMLSSDQNVLDVMIILIFFRRNLKQLSSEEAKKELEREKLPANLDQFTGSVMYPDEVTSKWDLEGK